MEHIIKKLALSASEFDSMSTGSLGTTKGLDRLTAFKGIPSSAINFIYAIYLEDRLARIKLKAHLNSKCTLSDKNKHYTLNIVNGAIKAYETNSYRVVECYKCKSKGCSRCGNTGRTSKKPKEYEICNISRSTWHNHNLREVRAMYARLYDVLHNIEIDIKFAVDSNQ